MCMSTVWLASKHRKNVCRLLRIPFVPKNRPWSSEEICSHLVPTGMFRSWICVWCIRKAGIASQNMCSSSVCVLLVIRDLLAQKSCLK